MDVNKDCLKNHRDWARQEAAVAFAELRSGRAKAPVITFMCMDDLFVDGHKVGWKKLLLKGRFNMEKLSASI